MQNKYYVPVAISEKPFLTWVETNDENAANATLLSNIPKIQFGVYPVKLVEEELVQLTEAELAEYEAEFSVAMAKLEKGKKTEAEQTSLVTGTFMFNGVVYPLHLHVIARLLALKASMVDGAYVAFNMYDKDGEVQTIASENAEAFLNDAIAQIIYVTEPVIPAANKKAKK
jgi:diadenosine tetraphosphate (Ap4A) HIT family hydrolase